MVQAWYMDNNTKDPQAENHRVPAKYISIEDLRNKTGVEYFEINIKTYKSDNILEGIKKERGYTYEDEMTCSDACENYQDRLKIFFTEHLHKDEEIRLVLDGEGYFDVRDADDDWIRIHVTSGDMLILPSGIYHRFTLTPKNYVKAKRFFIGEPVWQPYNRPADEMTCRQLYVDKLHKGFTQTC